MFLGVLLSRLVLALGTNVSAQKKKKKIDGAMENVWAQLGEGTCRTVLKFFCHHAETSFKNTHGRLDLSLWGDVDLSRRVQTHTFCGCAEATDNVHFYYSCDSTLDADRRV